MSKNLTAKQTQNTFKEFCSGREFGTGFVDEKCSERHIMQMCIGFVGSERESGKVVSYVTYPFVPKETEVSFLHLFPPSLPLSLLHPSPSLPPSLSLSLTPPSLSLSLTPPSLSPSYTLLPHSLPPSFPHSLTPSLPHSLLTLPPPSPDYVLSSISEHSLQFL